MAYFKIIDKTRKDGFVNTVSGASALFDEIEDIVGMKECPCNGIPYALEVEGWGELCAIGEIYETEDFVVECLTLEEWLEYQD